MSMVLQVLHPGACLPVWPPSSCLNSSSEAAMHLDFLVVWGAPAQLTPIWVSLQPLKHVIFQMAMCHREWPSLHSDIRPHHAGGS